jgi:hypothetical protein
MRWVDEIVGPRSTKTMHLVVTLGALIGWKKPSGPGESACPVHLHSLYPDGLTAKGADQDYAGGSQKRLVRSEAATPSHSYMLKITSARRRRAIWSFDRGVKRPPLAAAFALGLVLRLRHSGFAHWHRRQDLLISG